MDFNQLLLFLHVAAAGTWLGTNIVQAIAPGLLAKQGPTASAAWFRATAAFGVRLYMPISIIVLATGVWMVLRIEDYGFGTRFVTVGFATIIISIVLGVRIFTPGGEVAALAAESGDETQAKKVVQRLAKWGTFDTLLLLFTFAVMVIRWS